MYLWSLTCIQDINIIKKLRKLCAQCLEIHWMHSTTFTQTDVTEFNVLQLSVPAFHLTSTKYTVKNKIFH
jgi:hypothetical protein